MARAAGAVAAGLEAPKLVAAPRPRSNMPHDGAPQTRSFALPIATISIVERT
jgi:hypothetical protein